MSVANRTARRTRKTNETDIKLFLNLDGRGTAQVKTGIGFFDHMLDAFARHGLFDLEVEVDGDLEVDGHHTVEDTGLTLGAAFNEALGDKRSIRRFGSAYVPMDDALVLAVVDLSGRAYVRCDGFVFREPSVGAFDTPLAEEFFRAFATACGCNLHLKVEAGDNAHHIIEAAFKALARALDEAVQIDERVEGIPSTKGSL